MVETYRTSGSDSAVRLLRGPSRWVLALGLLAVLAVGPTAAALPYPNPVTPFSDPSDPYGVLAADFDADGLLDVVVSLQEGNAVAVLLGRGDGSFAPAVRYPVGTEPRRLAMGDFNEDGHPDLAVPNWGGGDLSILIGVSDGSFEGETRYPLGASSFPGQIVTADFNEDDHLDLLVTGGGRLLIGVGDGTFLAAGPLPDQILVAAVADFDRDGHQDYADTYTMFFGDGSGQFLRSQLLGTANALRWIVAGDLSGDDVPDVVLCDDNNNETVVMLGVGDGTFGPEQRYSTSVAPRFSAIEDLDGDGLADLIVSGYADPNGPGKAFTVHLGTGGGQFAPGVAVGRRAFAESVALGDFDGDGISDLAAGTAVFDDVQLFIGDGTGSFHASFELGVGLKPVCVAVADLDGDGREDVVAANEDSTDVSVLLANGAGTFASQLSMFVGTEPTWLTLEELTGDSQIDLVVAHASPFAGISLYQGNGDGTFTALSTLTVGTGSSSSAEFVTAADLDDDGHADLVVANEGAGSLSVFLGNGDGTFGAQSIIAVGAGPSWVAIDDLDGDEIVDLAVTNSDLTTISILLGVGDGSFVAGTGLLVPLGIHPSAVAAADLTGDLEIDLAVATDKNVVYVFTGNGDGTFQAGMPVSIGLNHSTFPSILIEDLTGDGLLDLVTTTWDVVVLEGDGAGSFGTAVHYGAQGSWYSVASGDFDLDGRVDLVSSGSYVTEYAVSVLLNQNGPSVFTFLEDRATLVWPAAPGALSYDLYRGNLGALVDTDGDGLPDSGYGACISGLDDDTRNTTFHDPDMPSSGGTGFFYLMSVIDAGGDQGLGTTSSDLARQPATPCP